MNGKNMSEGQWAEYDLAVNEYGAKPVPDQARGHNWFDYELSGYYIWYNHGWITALQTKTTRLNRKRHNSLQDALEHIRFMTYAI